MSDMTLVGVASTGIEGYYNTAHSDVMIRWYYSDTTSTQMSHTRCTSGVQVYMAELIGLP